MHNFARTQCSAPQHRTISRLLEERYGITVSRIDVLGGEHDLNLRCTDNFGGFHFVRLTPTWLDQRTVEWQNLVLAQLAEHPISVTTPKLVQQRDGAIMSMHEVPEIGAATLRVTTWVPGVGLSELGATGSTVRHQMGEIAAELVESLSPLTKVYDRHNEHHWMVTRSGEAIRETIDAVTNVEDQQLLREALARFDAVAPMLATLPRAAMHQDLHDFNLLAKTDQLGRARICGIVDFNDAVVSARISELAIAAAYAGLRQKDPVTAFFEVCAGYLSRASLTEAELHALYPAAVARLAVNASTWAARSHGENATYALARSAATWPALAAYLRVSPEEAFDKLHSIQAVEHH